MSRCLKCQHNRPAPPSAVVRDWEAPRGPCARIHLDLAGPFYGRMFLVTVDVHSKWVELALLPATTTAAVIGVLEGLFATHGLPDVVVTDNGP